jgi:hypothetical protein
MAIWLVLPLIVTIGAFLVVGFSLRTASVAPSAIGMRLFRPFAFVRPLRKVFYQAAGRMKQPDKHIVISLRQA